MHLVMIQMVQNSSWWTNSPFPTPSATAQKQPLLISALIYSIVGLHYSKYSSWNCISWCIVVLSSHPTFFPEFDITMLSFQFCPCLYKVNNISLNSFSVPFDSLLNSASPFLSSTFSSCPYATFCRQHFVLSLLFIFILYFPPSSGLLRFIHTFSSVPLSSLPSQMPPPSPDILISVPHPQPMPPSQSICTWSVLQKGGKVLFCCESFQPNLYLPPFNLLFSSIS